MRLLSFLSLCGVMVGVATTLPVETQAQSSLPKTHVAEKHDSSSRLVSFSLKDITVKDALAAVSKKTGLAVSMNGAAVPLEKRIDLTIRQATSLQAFNAVVRDLGLTAKLSKDGQTVFFVRPDTGAPRSDSVGRVTGRVVDSATGKGISGVTVHVLGTETAATTRVDGTFTLTGVPLGEQRISYRLFGYQPGGTSVMIVERPPTVVRITMTAIATQLSGVVTTATGIQRSYEIGSDVTRIDVDEVRKYNDIKSVADLLANRVPGMFMQSGGGDAGAGNRIRIRGIHSLTLSNDPILIIDGVRIQTIGKDDIRGPRGNQIISTLSSRLDDIDPASIETIEVFKGPSAATLYGPDAANGVIVITKKRGHAGVTRWSISASSRVTGIPQKFPGTRRLWGVSPESNDPVPCDRSSLQLGYCSGGDSVTVYSPLNDERYTTMGRGYNNDFGMTMTTGTKEIQTNMSFRVVDVLSPTKLSNAGIERVQAIKGQVPYSARRPSARQQMNGDVNMNIQSLPIFDVGLQASVMHSKMRNNGNGIGAALRVSGDTSQILPEQEFLQRNEELMDQYSASLQLQMRQQSWFAWRGTFGIQHGKTLRDDWRRAEDCLQTDCSNAVGSRKKGNISIASYSVGSSATVTTPLSPWMRLQSSVGLDYSRNSSDVFLISGSGMPLGISDPSLAPVVDSKTQASANAHAGIYLQERLSVDNRLFVTGAVRRDAGSAIGSQAKTPTFPKFDLSWLAFDRPIAIPKIAVLHGVRLRTAYGQSGQQPTLSDLKATLTKETAWYDGASHTVYRYRSLGNALTVPERTRELEFGVDLEFQGRIERVSMTYFHQITNDARISYRTSLESGLPILDRIENIGKLQNTGFSANTSLRMVDTRFASWTLNASISHTGNKVLSLGRFPQMPPSSGGRLQQRVVVGYPAFGVWMNPIYGYEDRNHNGTLDANEYVRGDSLVYVGWGQPKYSLSYNSSLALWRGNLRLSASLSHNVGLTKRMSMGWTGSAVGDIDGQMDDIAFLSEVVQTVSSLSWNQADVTAELPQRLLRYVRARSGSMSISGSNLHLWTNYRGADPNVGSVIGIEGSRDDGVTPNPRTWTLRLRINY